MPASMLPMHQYDASYNLDASATADSASTSESASQSAGESASDQALSVEEGYTFDTSAAADQSAESSHASHDEDSYAADASISAEESADSSHAAHQEDSYAADAASESSESSASESAEEQQEQSASASEESESHSAFADESYNMNASVDATLVFGASLDAETFSKQYAVGNITHNLGSTNTAILGSDIAVNAAGNIGVNVAAGNSNAQGNQLAIASGDASQATATTTSYQVAMGNTTNNVGWFEEGGVITTEVELSGMIGGEYEGTGGDGDALSFTEEGTLDLGEVTLTGFVEHAVMEFVQGHTNDATLGGNAFANASGNIGVNVAAGSNNLQGNALSIAAARTPAVAP